MNKRLIRFVGILGVLLMVSGFSVFAQNVVWEEIPGNPARDVAIGGSGGANDDVVYMIGKDDVDIRYGGWVYRWNEQDYNWERLPGLAVAVSVSPTGIPWVVNGEGKIFEWVQNRFVERPGYNQYMRARDIGIGHSGVVMIISKNDGYIYYWNGYRWSRKCTFYQGATRIDVDYSGNPWVVNSQNHVFQYLNGGWIDMTSGEQSLHGWDIGTDLNGWEAWTPRQDQFNSPEGGPFYYAMAGSSARSWYVPVDPENSIKGVRIDLSDGVLWMVTATGAIFRGIMD